MPNDKSVKPGPRGRRPGAGRPKGARGKANVEREARAREIVADVMTKLGHASADDLGPLEIALLPMIWPIAPDT